MVQMPCVQRTPPATRQGFYQQRTSDARNIIRNFSVKLRPAGSISRSSRNKAVACTAVRIEPLDLLQAGTTSGATEPLQVLHGGDGQTFTALWKGKVLKLTAPAGGAVDQGSWATEQIGSYPSPESDMVKAFPQLGGKLLEDLHSHAGAPQPSFASLNVVYSLQRLRQDVAQDAAPWCEGTQPGAPERTALQSLTLTAGELESLIQGKRGVVIVQLWNGFDRSRGQPIYDPWVVELVEAALRTPGVRAVASVAPGGVGLTAVLYADREPWNVWGPHLASFGCQANAVAGSPYYKLLIGKILGYKEEHVHGYIRSLGGGLTPAVIAQVDADLKKLSKAKPKLPWNREGSRGKKTAAAAIAPAAAAAAVPKAVAPAGRRSSGRK